MVSETLLTAWPAFVLNLAPLRVRAHLLADIDTSVVKIDASSLQKALLPQDFGAASGHIDIARTEGGSLGSFRWQCQGTRTVVLVSIQAVQDHLLKSTRQCASLEEVVKWSMNATPQQLQNLLRDSPESVQFGTVGPKDALWTPALWMSFHNVLHGDDVIGLKQALLMKSDAKVFERQSLERSKAGLPKHPVHIQLLAWFEAWTASEGAGGLASPAAKRFRSSPVFDSPSPMAVSSAGSKESAEPAEAAAAELEAAAVDGVTPKLEPREEELASDEAARLAALAAAPTPPLDPPDAEGQHQYANHAANDEESDEGKSQEVPEADGPDGAELSADFEAM